MPDDIYSKNALGESQTKRPDVKADAERTLTDEERNLKPDIRPQRNGESDADYASLKAKYDQTPASFFKDALLPSMGLPLNQIVVVDLQGNGGIQYGSKDGSGSLYSSGVKAMKEYANLGIHEGGKTIEPSSDVAPEGTGTPHAQPAAIPSHLHYLSPEHAAYATRAAVDWSDDAARKSLSGQIEESAVPTDRAKDAAQVSSEIYNKESDRDHNTPEVQDALIKNQGEAISQEHIDNMVVGHKTDLISMDKGLSHEDSNQASALSEPKEAGDEQSKEVKAEQDKTVGDAEPASSAQKEGE